jgi:hypothetical protein
VTRLAALVALPLLTLLTGCKALTRDAESVEYRPGTAPTTVIADRDAEYRLYAPEKLEWRLPVDVAKGERVGFRYEPDGSLVAIAGKETTPIPDGQYVWLCTPKPVTWWDRAAVKSRDKCENAFYTALFVITAPFWLGECAKTGVWP